MPKVKTANKARGRRSPRTSGDERERTIVETAERLLGEKSFGEITIDDLAKGAGISRPTFYFYFPSKDALVMTIVERFIADTMGDLTELLADLETDPRGTIRDALKEIFTAFSDRREVVLAAEELRTYDSEAQELWRQIMEGWVSFVAVAIEAERARGAASPGPDPRELAIALLQMNERVMRGVLTGESPALSEDRVLDVVVEIWLRAIYGSAEPASPSDLT
jgi:TetR/AcrR family transcriptional regulator, ethionamide resistance regulator